MAKQTIKEEDVRRPRRRWFDVIKKDCSEMNVEQFEQLMKRKIEIPAEATQTASNVTMPTTLMMMINDDDVDEDDNDFHGLYSVLFFVDFLFLQRCRPVELANNQLLSIKAE